MSLYGHANLLGSRSLSKDCNLIDTFRYYNNEPLITYGAETWLLRKSDKKKLLVIKRKELPTKDILPIMETLSG